MSYSEQPNPYVAPRSQVSGQDGGRTPATGYGGFWVRVVASIIDGIITGILGAVAGFIVGRLMGVGNDPTRAQTATLVGYVLVLVIGIVYYAGMESSASQATVGKQAMGLKVTNLKGRRISFPHAVGRYFAKILSTITFGIGYIMVAFTAKKQGLHDMVASTLVVKTR